ncbi:hypothetical protein P872_21695 [Rhodonellum psychrophilum GCM71 = DSM 17998]|uniref:Uncharacterized protein n=1 Tax=Rhodonellum psychrophilum GCM71 = DSM 17998 TaxID=1123057 RepID=U5BJ55_9BACT|nr:hypothetical protein P872_21695 [Rhodonellum psychrophilum GCM71 = DSM 17998]
MQVKKREISKLTFKVQLQIPLLLAIQVQWKVKGN